MLLSSLFHRPCLNLILKSYFNVKIFGVDYITQKNTPNFSTKVVSSTRLNAVVHSNAPDTLLGFSLDMTASTTGVARHKMFNSQVCATITIEQIKQASMFSTAEDRRNAVTDLLLLQMAKMQFTLVQAEINSNKNYSDLFNNKVFQDWYYSPSKPLLPQTVDLNDKTNLIDATYQAVTGGYIEVASYLIDLVHDEHRLLEVKQVA